MSVTRRQLLMTGAAFAAAPIVPSLPAPAASASMLAPSIKPVWIVGTPGEFDWKAIVADTIEDAISEYKDYSGFDDDPLSDDCDFSECVCRVPEWDGRDPKKITSGDWLCIGYGAICSRCDYETFPDAGARSIAGKAVCADCLAIPDLLAGDEQDVLDGKERLISHILTHDCDEAAARASIWLRCNPDAIAEETWAECLAAAKEAA